MRTEAVPAAYRVFFRHAGMDPDDRRPPSEAAAMRRLMEGGFVSRSWLEDALLLAVLETGVPVWALDAERVDGPLGIRVAGASERLGEGELAPDLRPGRMVVADAAVRGGRPVRRRASRRVTRPRATPRTCCCSRWPSTACPSCTSRRRCSPASTRLVAAPTAGRLAPMVDLEVRTPQAPTVAPARGAEAERAARRQLRDQIATLEARLSEALVTAFPHGRIDTSVAVRRGAGGPRLLTLGELEAVRDALADRVAGARAELEACGAEQERKRIVLEKMLLEPGRYKFARISQAELGAGGCGVWQVRPRLGIIGMLAGWWHVKLSSGCPLAT